MNTPHARQTSFPPPAQNPGGDQTLGLTPRQAECLLFIEARLMLTRVCPSYDEIRLHLGSKSKSGVHRLVDGLVERGYLRRGPGKTHRSLALTTERCRCPNCGHPLSEGVQQ